MKKLAEQFEIDWNGDPSKPQSPPLSEELASLVYVLDVLNKHLIDIDTHPIRKVRGQLDEFAKVLMQGDKAATDKALFELRQWYASYRIDETTYVQNTFDDFKRIIWEFADQMSEEIKDERATDKEIAASLEGLREAVEANSIDSLRAKSREFINNYVEHQLKKETRRDKRMTQVRKNLGSVKKQLMAANHSMKTDHLTGADNRKSFDELLKNHWRLFEMEKTPCTLVLFDIDHFKKINDSHGHDIGDFVLKECVQLLKQSFKREQDVVARIGGEEFAVILPGLTVEQSLPFIEACMDRIRKEVFLHGDLQIRFTASLGISPATEGETCSEWIKKADMALYHSKNNGRNRYTLATALKIEKVA